MRAASGPSSAHSVTPDMGLPPIHPRPCPVQTKPMSTKAAPSSKVSDRLILGDYRRIILGGTTHMAYRRADWPGAGSCPRRSLAWWSAEEPIASD